MFVTFMEAHCINYANTVWATESTTNNNNSYFTMLFRFNCTSFQHTSHVPNLLSTDDISVRSIIVVVVIIMHICYAYAVRVIGY